MIDYNVLVRNAIKRAGFTASEMSRRTGADLRSLGSFLRGGNGITLATFAKIAPLLGLGICRVEKKLPKDDGSGDCAGTLAPAGRYYGSY